MQVLVQIDAWDTVSNGEVSLLAASHDDARVCHASGNVWWPTIAKLPTLRYDLFDGAFGQEIGTPSSSLTLQIEPWPNFPRYSFPDARLRLWTGDVDDPANVWTLRFDGRVTAQPQIDGGAAVIDFAVDDRWLDTALLATYAGTTGAEGPAAMKGQAKPLALGAPRYAPGKLIDSVNNVFQVSAYGAVQEFEAALERLVRFGSPIADYPTYAALVAATVPAGTWATAKAVGMARFGAPTTGQISFLLKGDAAGADGWARRAGQLVRRIAQLSGGAGKLDDASLNALDAARPYNLSIYLDEQTTARELVQQLAASLNAVAGVSWLGKLFIAPVGLGVPSLTLAADGSALPPVSSVKQIDVASPWQKLAIGAERAWVVHALSDVAFTAPLLPMGLYSSTTIYREGNLVDLADGSQWLYTATTPASGNAPPTSGTSNAWWSRRLPPTSLSSIGYTGDPDATRGAAAGLNLYRTDGVTVMSQGEVRTPEGTAAGIAGQGSFATVSSITSGNAASLIAAAALGYTLLAATAVRLGVNITRSDGSTSLTDAAAVTALGTAAGIAGQGSFATISSITSGNASSLIGAAALGYTLLAATAVRLGVNITRSDGSTALTDAMAVTALGTAAGILGQGWGATASESQASNALVPTGVNILVNSSFQRGTFGWRISSATLGVNYPNYYGRRNVAYMHYEGILGSGATIDAAPYGQWLGNSTSEMRSYCLPVALGQKVGCRALVSVHRCAAELYILAFDMNGGLLAAPFTSTGYTTTGAYQGDNMGEMTQTYTVDNANVAYVQFMIRMRGTAESDPYVFFAEPWLGKLSASQSIIPAYAPGPPDFAADRTLDNTAAAITGQGALATVSQVTAGYLASGVLGQDLLLNGGAEAGIDGWVPSFWFDAGSTATSYAAANPKSGSKVFRLLKTSTGNSSSIRSKAIPVTPGKLYVFRGSAIGSAATAGSLYIRLYMGNNVDAAGYLTASDYLVSAAENAAFTTSWATFERSIAIPAGYRFIEFHFLNYAGGPLEAWGDDFQVYEQTTAGLLTSNAVQLGLNITRADGGTSLTDAMAVTALGTAAAILGQGALATINLITSQYLRPGVASDNLIPNADFAEGNVRWALTGASYVSATNNPWPAAGAAFIATGATGYVDANNGSQIFLAYQRIHMSAWFFAVSGTAAGQLQAYCYRPDGTYLNVVVVPITLSAAGAWYHAGGWMDLPAGTAQVIFRWTMSNSSGQNVFMTGMRAAPTEYGGDVTINAQFLVDMAKTVDISFDYTGTTASGLPKAIPVTVTRGGVNVTTDNAASYSVSNFTGGCTNVNVTVDNANGSGTKGRPTISAGSAAPGSFDWIMTYGGQQVAKVTITVTKTLASAPAGSGSGSSGYTKSGTLDPGGQGVGSTSFSEFGRVSNINVASGESLYASFNANYDVSGGGNFVSRTLIGKFQRSPAGANTWTDMGSQVTGTTASFNNLTFDGVSGDITINQTASPGAGNYDVRLLLAESSQANSSVISLWSPAPGSVIAKV